MGGILSWTRCRRALLLRTRQLEELAELDRKIVETTTCFECLALPGIPCHVLGEPHRIRGPHLVRQRSHDRVRAEEAAAA